MSCRWGGINGPVDWGVKPTEHPSSRTGSLSSHRTEPEPALLSQNWTRTSSPLTELNQNRLSLLSQNCRHQYEQIYCDFFWPSWLRVGSGEVLMRWCSSLSFNTKLHKLLLFLLSGIFSLKISIDFINLKYYLFIISIDYWTQFRNKVPRGPRGGVWHPKVLKTQNITVSDDITLIIM